MSITPKCTFAALPRTERGKHIVLGADPKGNNFLYTIGNSVIIRDIKDVCVADVYTQHSVPTNLAKYSPSGFYIASADNSGKVRIWDTVNAEHILKNEYQPFAGAVKDLAWSADSQKIVAVGEGKEKFGHVFNADTGTSVGNVNGHTKSINSVDYRSSRPFRIVTAGEDRQIGFFEGPPFKFMKTINNHTNFVNCVRFTPNGDKFISGGADGRAFVFDGKTADNLGQLGDPAHKGGIYALSFSPDGVNLMTASADKTVKVWNVETLQQLSECVMGTAVADMQVGCLWQSDYLLSVSVSGYINYQDANNPGTVTRIIKGHNKPITSMALTLDRGTILTSSSDGRICKWDSETGLSEVISGIGHTCQIQSIAVFGDQLITCGIDDTVRYVSINKTEYEADNVKLPSQPKCLAAGENGLVVVACINEVVVIRSRNIVSSKNETFEPCCVSVHRGQGQVAVGGQKDSKVHIYSLDVDTLVEVKTLHGNGEVTDVKYSPDGAWLAASNSNRSITVFDVANDYAIEVDGSNWQYHSAKVQTLAWSPDSRHLASGSLDTSIRVWSVENKGERIVMKGAHTMSNINAVCWLSDNVLVSAGQDSHVKLWTVTY